MSTQYTSEPSAAKPAAVTSPTYPVPITAIGSRLLAALAMRRGSVLTEPLERGCDADHLVSVSDRVSVFETQ